MFDTVPHSDFWALQETHWRGIGHVAAAQRWARKRGWAASFQDAEVVGQHNAANRGGVAIAGLLHTSSSAPSEFESMLDEAAILAPESVEQPLPCLHSRILARHTHAMLKRGVTFVTVYLEPGMRASGLNLWLLEVLAACVLCFDGPWIAMGDWNMEPHDLSQAGWLDTVNGKVFASSAAGAVLDYFVLSEVMAHLVQQVEVVDNSPTTPHWPVRLTRKATSWGHRVLVQTLPKPFPTCGTTAPGGARRLDPGGRGNPGRHGAGMVGVVARRCRIHDLYGAQRRPFLERNKGGVIEHVSLGQGTRNDTRRSCSRKAGAACWPRRLATWLLGGRGGPRSTRYNGQFTRLPQSLCPTLAPGTQAGIFRRKKLWQTPCTMQPPGRIGQTRSRGSCFSSRATRNKQSMLRLQIRRVAGGNGRRSMPGVGAAQGFAEVGIDDGEVGGPVGPELLVKQMGTWLMLWLDGRRANAKQRRIGESLCQDPHSQRSTMSAKHTSTQQGWATTALTPRRFCSCQWSCVCVSSTCSWL